MTSTATILAHATDLVVREVAKATHTDKVQRVTSKARRDKKLGVSTLDTKVMVNTNAGKVNRMVDILKRRHFNVKVLGATGDIMHAKKRVRIGDTRYHALVLYNAASGALRIITRS